MPKLLLVDDDLLLTNLLSLLLEKESYDVKVCNLGVGAQLALATESFDILVFDWDLPDGNGPDLCKGYRESGGMSPVILLTARVDISAKEIAFESGADDYLIKPFEPRDLFVRLKALLRRSQSAVPTSATVLERKVSAPHGLKVHVSEALSALGNRYEPGAAIGEGAMGLVFHAQDTVLNRAIAIKLLNPSTLTNEESLARFKQEAQSIAQLSHPNIISIYDYGVTTNGVPFLVMEIGKGESLATILLREHQIPWKRCVKLFIQLSSALLHAHSSGIIHRDIKPSNVLIDNFNGEDSRLKLIDFGVAKVLSESNAQTVSSTKANQIFGSPLYMSPEQCSGGKIDGRADIFSLGYMFYECLTGFKLFLGDNDFETMYKRIVDVPLPFRIIRPDLDLPVALESLVLKAMSVRQEDRQQSALEIKAGLESLLETTG